jgi:hypothetical protein
VRSSFDIGSRPAGGVAARFFGEISAEATERTNAQRNVTQIRVASPRYGWSSTVQAIARNTFAFGFEERL